MVLGERHPSTLLSMADLAFTWKSQGRLGDALGLIHHCYHLVRSFLGSDHQLTIAMLSALEEWQKETDGLHGDTNDLGEAGTSG